MPELSPEQLALVETGALEDESDEVDEILEELRAQKTINETQYTELSERLTQCLTRLEALSAGSNAENPLLTQLSNQIAEIRVDVTEALTSLRDMKVKIPERKESTETVVEVPPDQNLPSLDESMVEPSEENETPIPRRKHRVL